MKPTLLHLGIALPIKGPSAELFRSSVHIGLNEESVRTLSPSLVPFQNLYTYFVPEDGGRIHLRNVGNIVHNHIIQKPRNKVNIHY
jgi:hypothetical protein